MIMKKSASQHLLFLGTICLCMLGCQDDAPGPPYSGSIDMTGEWALEWEDKKNESRETIYVWITQEDDHLSGHALDPNLIPATVEGSMDSGNVSFTIAPHSGRGFRAPTPPATEFTGIITAANTMTGKYECQRLRGPWNATKTQDGNNRTVTVEATTKLTFPLTSEEYDMLFHPLAGDKSSSVYTPLTDHEKQYKESRRVGDHYEVEFTVGEPGGLIYHYRLLGDFVRIDPNTHKKEKRLQEKILIFLNENGYPWKTITR
jgi:hypothetical protein